MSPFLTELWCLVTDMGPGVTVMDMRAQQPIAALCQQWHANLVASMQSLVRSQCMTYDSATLAYSWTAACRVPQGCAEPARRAFASGYEVAASRTVTALATPVDTARESWNPTGPRFETHLFPSRVGDRLYFKDGRITDLAGNPIEGCN